MSHLRSAVRVALEGLGDEDSESESESDVEPPSKKPGVTPRRRQDDDSDDEQGGRGLGAANVSAKDRMAHEAYMSYMSYLRTS
jgi:hypothetical protein